MYKLKVSKLKILTNIIPALYFLLSAQPLQANERRIVIDNAIDLCLKLPSNQKKIDAKLKSNGWIRKIGESGEKLALSILYSALFTINHRSEDLHYTYTNSVFMAASILGNSALTSGQPVYNKGELKLGVFGVQEGAGYCLLSGPSFITADIENKLGVKLKQILPYMKSYQNLIGDSELIIREIDIEKFHSIKPEIESEISLKYRMFERQFLYETNLYIIP